MGNISFLSTDVVHPSSALTWLCSLFTSLLGELQNVRELGSPFWELIVSDGFWKNRSITRASLPLVPQYARGTAGLPPRAVR